MQYLIRISRRARFALAGFLTLSGVVARAGTRFAVVGDFGDGGDNAVNVADRLKSFKPQFVTTVGDNIYTTGGTIAEFDTAIGNKYGSFIKNNASPTQTAKVNNFYPSVGNHDIDANPSTDAANPAFLQNYYNYFDLTPANDSAISPSSGNERYYDVVRGDVHLFIVSADTRDTQSGQAPGSPQRNWLMGTAGNNGVLAASKSPWNIVVFHQPAYSTESATGDHFSNAYLQWGFQGAQVIYNGHAHDYERTAANGQQYVVDGAGGRSLSTFSAPAYTGPAPNPVTIVRDSTSYGFTLVDANTAYFTSKHFLQNGNLTDQFTVIAPGIEAVHPVAFQQNAGGYTGTRNRELREDGAATLASAATLKIDNDDNAAAGNQRTQGLLVFQNIIGSGTGQIPSNALITAAKLRINVTDQGSGLALYRMLTTWTDTSATWGGLGTGVQTDGIEAVIDFDQYAGLPNATNVAPATHVGTGFFTFDVSTSVQAWANGAPNNGWLFDSLSGGTDGIIFSSANSATPPLLSVEFLPITALPEPGSLALLAGGAALLLRPRRRPCPRH